MNKRASVLMISLWVLAILVIFALGLGHRAAINLRLGRYQRDSLKGYYLAMAGVNKAISVLNADDNAYDTLKEAWSTGVEQITGKNIFKDIELNPGSKERFTVGFIDKGGNYHCMADEESRVNLNSAGDEFGREQFVELLKLKDFADASARELAGILYEWISPAAAGGLEPAGKSFFKKSPLQVKEELIPVLESFYDKDGSGKFAKEMQDAYAKIKDFVTVHSALLVNINTASEDVVRATVLASARPVEGATAVDAEAVITRIINFRNGGGEFYSADAESIKSKLGITQEGESAQANIVNELAGHITFKSDTFEIISTGRIGPVTRKITAVYGRGQEKNIFSWQEN